MACHRRSTASRTHRTSCEEKVNAEGRSHVIIGSKSRGRVWRERGEEKDRKREREKERGRYGVER
mgnify:CR=1 FL=1|jgi:hypothetical protein